MPDNGDMVDMLLLLPIVLPAAFWVAYHRYQDRHLPEPPGHLALALLLGFAACWLAAGGYSLLGWLELRADAQALGDESPLRLFLYTMLAIGPIEELAKLLPFLLVVVRFDEFDEPMDGIIYASFIGLGFAFAENLQYLYWLSPLEALARGFAGPVVHITLASIWGYHVGLAKLEGRALLPPALLGFAIAAGAHGLYDFFVLLKPMNALPLAAVLIAVMWLWRLRILRDMHEAAAGGGGGEG